MRALIVAAALMLGACSNQPGSTVPASSANDCCGWQAQYSAGVKLTAAVKGFQFEFPTGPNSVHYLVAPQPGVALKPGQSITALAVITGINPVFVQTDNGCPSPALMRLYIQQKGDNLGGAGPYAYYRWWSTASFALRLGNIVLSTTLTPGNWSSVYGEKGDASPAATAGFNAAIANAQAIGVTFGGCFAGHGAQLQSGSAQFNMQSLSF